MLRGQLMRAPATGSASTAAWHHGQAAGLPIAASGTWNGLPQAEHATGTNIVAARGVGQSMILLSGYSTMPQAPAAFRRGMM